MQAKTRVLRALNHQTPDRVPFDLGATAVTGMHVQTVTLLREALGLEKTPVKVIDPFQMLGEIAPDLQAALQVDVEGVQPRENLFGFANENWKPFRFADGLEVLVPGGFETQEDANGGLYLFPGGDRSAEPSGHLPAGGHYFDAIIRQEPIDEENLNPADNLEEFHVLSDAELSQIETRLHAARSSGRAVIANIGQTAIGDIALVPAPFLKKPRGIRDIEEWYVSTLTRQDYLHQVFAAQTDIALANLRQVAERAADLIDVLFICGTDFGTQTGTFCSPATYRDLYHPYYKKMNDWIHAHTAWKTFKHSCGAVFDFIPLFKESGFDILNPVQCSATGMDPVRLKKTYGQDMVFWGGGVDTQRVLPFGTPAQVKEQVRRRIDIFGENGGMVMAPIHNIQKGTPVENILAMLAAIQEV